MINLREIAEALNEQATYQEGLECLVGFLLAQMEPMSGFSRTALLDDLEAEQRWRLEADALSVDDPRHVPLPASLLLPFQRLEAQLRAQTGDALVPEDLPKSLQLRYPRLEGAPRSRLRVVPASPGDTPPEG